LQGVLLGLLLGCALVLWFSPQSGKELFATVKKRLPISASNPTGRREP
jgi:gas vesicle protein